MALTASAIALIGRTHPEIFELFGNPIGPRAIGIASVHASVLEHVALNPQPLPPKEAGLRVGTQTGIELLRLANVARHLNIAFEIDPDNWCPTPPRKPKLPPPVLWPPPPLDDPDDPHWHTGFALGLAAVLEVAAPGLEGLEQFGALDRIHDNAMANVAALG